MWPFPMVALLENVYQVKQGLEGFMIWKITKKDIQIVLPELNAKVKLRK